MDDAERGERVAELEALRVSNVTRTQALLAVPGAPPAISFSNLFLEVLLDGLYPPGSDERTGFDLRWEGAKAAWLDKAETESRRAALLAGVGGAPPPIGPPGRGNGQQ